MVSITSFTSSMGMSPITRILLASSSVRLSGSFRFSPGDRGQHLRHRDPKEPHGDLGAPPGPPLLPTLALPAMGSGVPVSMLAAELLVLSFLLKSGVVGTATVLTAAGGGTNTPHGTPTMDWKHLVHTGQHPSRLLTPLLHPPPQAPGSCSPRYLGATPAGHPRRRAR